MFDIASQFRLGLLACSTTLAVIFPVRVAAGRLRNSIVQEGDIQVTIPYVLYREALLWIRRIHRPLSANERPLGKRP